MKIEDSKSYQFMLRCNEIEGVDINNPTRKREYVMQRMAFANVCIKHFIYEDTLSVIGDCIGRNYSTLVYYKYIHEDSYNGDITDFAQGYTFFFDRFDEMIIKDIKGDISKAELCLRRALGDDNSSIDITSHRGLINRFKKEMLK